jgi:hypothetical protein
VVAALLASVAAVGAAGCGGPHPRPAALRFERAHLVLVAQLLERLQAPVAGEVAAARAVWPALARGLPAALTPAQGRALAAAARGSAALALPWYVTSTEGGGLTGPAAAVGGLLNGYASLVPRGWRFLAAALTAQAPSTVRFMRANAGLYVYCVYDGHYDLSLMGRALHDGYVRLGGAPAFGSSLTPERVAALVRAYSIPAGRLQPHPPDGLAV